MPKFSLFQKNTYKKKKKLVILMYIGKKGKEEG